MAGQPFLFSVASGLGGAAETICHGGSSAGFTHSPLMYCLPADIVGFTTISKQVEPEQVMHMLHGEARPATNSFEIRRHLGRRGSSASSLGCLPCPWARDLG